MLPTPTRLSILPTYKQVFGRRPLTNPSLAYAGKTSFKYSANPNSETGLTSYLNNEMGFYARCLTLLERLRALNL